MTHRANQAGFSAIHALIAVLVLAILGVAGWRVYDAQQRKTTTEEPTTTIEKAQPKEEYKAPEGFTVYENKDMGFKFAYPTAWGTLQSTAQSGLDLSLASKELGPNTATNTLTDKLEVWAASKQTFTVNVAYHGATVKPVIAGEAVTWQVVDAATQSETFKVGDMYTPEPQIVYEKDGLKVYEFSKVHASAKWYIYVFRAGERFVAIETPQSVPSIELSQQEFDAENAKNTETFTLIAKSIRLL